MRRGPPISALIVLVLMSADRDARAELRTTTKNAVVFVESSQKGEEWGAYRVARARSPVGFEVDGPGRVLLSHRTFVGSEAVAVVLLDGRIVLTSKVDDREDGAARFPDAADEKPTKIRLYLVRVPPGRHQVTIRYSGGGPTLVSGRFSEDAWDLDESLLVAPAAKKKASVPNVGKLRSAGALESEPPPEEGKSAERGQPKWELRQPDPPAVEEPILRPGARSARPPPVRADRSKSAAVARAPLTIRAPSLTLEGRLGIQINRLSRAVAPAGGVSGRIPVPGLDARTFSLGFSAQLAYASGDARVKAGLHSGPNVGVASLRYLAFAADIDVRWSFLESALLDPYLAAGLGATFGRLQTIRDDVELSGQTRGFYGVGLFGVALGNSGHRPFAEVRLQVGLLSSDLLRVEGSDGSGSATEVAASFTLGYRFEILADVTAE